MMTKESKCTYKELIEILLSAAASMLAEKDLNAEIVPLEDDDVGSLVYIFENIYYGPEEEEIKVHEIHCCMKHGCKYGDEDCPVANKELPGVKCDVCSEDEIIEEATKEYEATVDRPIQSKEGEEK